MESKHKEHILILSTAYWGELPPLSREELARAFAKLGHDVTYIQPPVSPLSLRYAFGRMKSLLKRKRMEDGVTIIAPRMTLPWHRLGIRRRADRVVYNAIKRVVSDHPVTIVWHNDPTMPGIRDLTPDALYIIHRTDKLAGLQGTKYAHVAARERGLVEDADLVFAISEDIRRESDEWKAKKVVMLPNAFDPVLLQDESEVVPAGELEDIPRPRAIITGSINARVDIVLIERMLKELPELQLIYVGEVRGEHGKKYQEKLRKLERVTLLPARPRKKLLPLLLGARVGLIPYIDTDFNRASFPLKVFDYLAAGLPVVSTNIPSLKRFDRHADVTESHDEFIAAVRRRIVKRSDQSVRRKRRNRIAGETWNSRAAEALVEIHIAVQEKERKQKTR